MDRIKALILAGFLAATGPAMAGEDALATARAAVLAKLKDPESARFRNLREVKGLVCGEVNAKNKFGGYDGFREFYFIVKLNKALIPGGLDITNDVLDHIAKPADSVCS